MIARQSVPDEKAGGRPLDPPLQQAGEGKNAPAGPLTLWQRIKAFLAGPRRSALFTSMLAVVLLVLLWWMVVANYESYLVNQERSRAQALVAGYDNALSTALARRLVLLSGMRAFVESDLNSHGAVNEAEFMTVGRDFFDAAGGVRELWWAPSGIQTYSFPIGLPGKGEDLLRSTPSERSADVARAISTREMVISPPLQANGGLLVEARLAVFHQSRFWGLVTITMDLESMLQESGLYYQMTGLGLGLRDQTGRLLTGSESVFLNDPVTETVAFPGGEWKMAAAPVSGSWTGIVSRSVDVLRLAGLAVILAVGGLTYAFTNRQARLEIAVSTRTRQLDQELVERRRIEEEVRESEEKYHTLVQTAPDAVLLQTPEGRVVDCNEAACRIFGYSREEMLLLSQADLVPGRLAHLLPRQMTKEMTTGGAFVETRYCRKNGQAFPAEVSSQMLTVSGQPYLFSYVRDIGRRKETEDAIHESQARYRSLVDTSPDAIALTDRKGHILLCNAKAAELYEFESPEAALGKNIFDLIAPEDRDRGLENARKLFKGAPYRDIEYVSLTSKGRRFQSEISATAIFDEHDRAVGFTGIARDISERKLQAREQAAIVVLASALRTAVTLEGISENILNQLLGLLNSDGAALFIHLPASGEAQCVRGVSRWQQWSGMRMARGEGVTARVIDTGQPFINNDIQRFPQTARLELRGGLNSIAGVPLIAHERTIGALWVGRNEPFREGELRVLMVIADMVANAVQRAALFEETQRRLQRLDILHQIDQTITAAQSLRQVLDFLLDKLMAQVGVDAADVFLVDEKSHALYFLAGRGYRRSSLRGLRLGAGEGYAGRVMGQGRTLFIPDLSREPAGQPMTQFEGEGFVAYCGLALVAKQQVRGVLEVFYRHPHAADPEWLDFLETLAGQAAIAIDNSILLESLQHSNQELVLAYERTLEGWARALELRDKETEGHTRRAADRTVELGRALNIPEDELVHIRRGALLHDIGKLAVPDKILLKPGPLDEQEWVIMRMHPAYARSMIEPIPYLRPALAIPYCHHENWDGSGYPQGLKGEQIPLAARIFTVLDVWDALTSDRVYRKAWAVEKACEYLRANAGKVFDPQVVEAFFRIGGDKWLEGAPGANGEGKG